MDGESGLVFMRISGRDVLRTERTEIELTSWRLVFPAPPSAWILWDSEDVVVRNMWYVLSREEFLAVESLCASRSGLGLTARRDK